MSHTQKYDTKSAWSKFFLGGIKMLYPSEYVIRIFKGEYPRLNLNKRAFSSQKICDLGCGTGRNLPLLKECGLNVYGMEITKEIVDKAKSNLAQVGIRDADIRAGNNNNVPFDDNFFDYLLSWNSYYYMDKEKDSKNYMQEFARVLKPGGYLILSIPKKTCFLFRDSQQQKPGYQIIKNDPFKMRNGEILRIFNNEQEIVDEFSPHFENFIFASIHDDCFGYNYHWHLVVCQRK